MTNFSNIIAFVLISILYNPFVQLGFFLIFLGLTFLFGYLAWPFFGAITLFLSFISWVMFFISCREISKL